MRKECNRAALKAFRKRKEQRFKNLEAEVDDLAKTSDRVERPALTGLQLN